jgi:hypothetical protein
MGRIYRLFSYFSENLVIFRIFYVFVLYFLSSGKFSNFSYFGKIILLFTSK